MFPPPREKYERWREHHALALKQVSEENSAKINALEADKGKKEEEFHRQEHALQVHFSEREVGEFFSEGGFHRHEYKK